MKVVSITGEKKAELVERPMPQAGEDLAVVKITVAPMCTEYKMFAGGYKADGLGHEAAGEVAEIAQPGKVRVGDRVVVMPQSPCGTCALCVAGEYIHCQHCVDPLAITDSASGTATYAQYILKQDWLLIPIPDDMSTEHASMACCGLGPTFGAMERMNVTAFDTVLITGLGPVGLGGVINAVYRGARVIGVDSQPFRAQLAESLGADAVVNPNDTDALKQIMDQTDGLGVDAAVDCSGVPAAQRLMIDAARRRGRVAFVGEGGEVTVHVSNDLLRKGLTLYGQWHYPLHGASRIMDVARRCGALLDEFITHRFPMSQVADAFTLQLTGNCGKVVLDPWA